MKINNNYKKREELLKSAEREKKRNYIILYTTVLLVWLLLTIYSFVKGFFSGEEFVINIINNIIGILPPILIFDFFNEKLSRDESAVEMSVKITDTLMGNPETLDLFTEEQRKNLIKSAIASIVDDEDTTEMINERLNSYLDSSTDYCIKPSFDYSIELYDEIPLAIATILPNKSDYIYVQEKLSYKVKYLSQKKKNLNSNIVKICFIFDNTNLDGALRENDSNEAFKDCIFRESLDMNPEDLKAFRIAAGTEEGFKKIFKADLQIDSFKGVIDSVAVYEAGIVCAFKVGYDTDSNEHSVRIIFHMPKLVNSLFEIALVDPVKAPKICLSYPEDKLNVDMFSFLSKGEEASTEVAHESGNGIYDIAINSEWIYPISGLIFKIERKNITDI